MWGRWELNEYGYSCISRLQILRNMNELSPLIRNRWWRSVLIPGMLFSYLPYIIWSQEIIFIIIHCEVNTTSQKDCNIFFKVPFYGYFLKSCMAGRCLEGKIYQFKLVDWVIYKIFICTEILIKITVVGLFLLKKKSPPPQTSFCGIDPLLFW